MVTSGFDGIGRDEIFHSNNSNSYSTGIDESGEVFLGRTVWVSFDANGGSGSMKQKAVAAGSILTPPVCGFMLVKFRSSNVNVTLVAEFWFSDAT